MNDALDFVVASANYDAISWFPMENELRSDKMYAYLWSIKFHGINPSDVELILVHPADRTIFFIPLLSG